MKDTKINVWRIENVVSFQVTELNNFEKYRNQGLLFTSSDNIQIYSQFYNKPMITDANNPIIYLPADKQYDYLVGQTKCNSVKEATDLLHRIHKTLIEWKNCEFKIQKVKDKDMKIINDLYEELVRLRPGLYEDHYIKSDFQDYMQDRIRGYKINVNRDQDTRANFMNYLRMCSEDFCYEVFEDFDYDDGYGYEDDWHDGYDSY